MTGYIVCNKCHATVKKGGLCPQCEKSYRVIVKLYWKGKTYEYRRDDQGYIFTYERAMDKLVELNNTIKRGVFNPLDFSSSKLKERRFELQAEKWLREKEREEATRELSIGTLKQYRSYVNNYFPFFHRMDVREIMLEDLTNFKDTLSGLSIKSRRNIFLALHSLFVWMRKKGTLKTLPEWVEIKGDDSKPTSAIDTEIQSDALQKLPRNYRDVIEFCMETGLRPGEVCALLVSHASIRQGSLRVERTFSGSVIRETTKQKRKRTIPLSDRALQIVTHHIEGKLPEAFLFVNPTTGTHYTTNRLTKIWKKYSDIGNVTLYEATRHSFGSQLIEHTDISTIKTLMGHSDIRTTERYLHGRLSTLRNVVNSRGKVATFRKKSTEKAQG